MRLETYNRNGGLISVEEVPDPVAARSEARVSEVGIVDDANVPAAEAGYAKLYVENGKMKVIFADGTTKEVVLR